jgi:hypothetical protein
MTAARGHAGDNAGRLAIEALLLNQDAQTHRAPVFGCELESLGTRVDIRQAHDRGQDAV